MGCDIHWVIERKMSIGYVGIYSTDLTPSFRYRVMPRKEMNSGYQRPILKERDYTFFTRIAGIKGIGPAPNGFPSDASHLAQVAYRGWGIDAHSPGHMPLHRFVIEKAIARLTQSSDEQKTEAMKRLLINGEEVGMKEWQEFAAMNYVESESDYRVVFWFDN